MKTAVILFNLGGPDSLDAVEPFLYNLFCDPVILGGPGLFRRWVARKIAKKRGPKARGIYEQLGGRSPLLPETEAQAKALQDVLGADFNVLIAMRYWHPFTHEAVQQAKQWGAERVVLLPLYPQFSITTSRSSFRQWRQDAAKHKLNVPTETICCYPTQTGWISALVDVTRQKWQVASQKGPVRILFSAHGLPQSIVDKGDPYPLHIEQTAKAVVSGLNLDGLDWAICYQSRVGPMKWIGPSTEEELTRAAEDKVGVVVVPIAFVSEHSETLVELDIEYRHLAEEWGVPAYERVPAVSTHPDFIAGLAELVQNTLACSRKGCDASGSKCPMREEI